MRRTPLVVVASIAAAAAVSLSAAPSSGHIAQPVRETGVQSQHTTILNAVSAGSAIDVWTVGYRNVDLNTTDTYTQHWNGQSWQVVPSPNPTPYNHLEGVDATSPSDVWAVGTTYQDRTPITEHWDGATWSVVPAPGVGGLYAVSALTPDDVWAVGRYAVGGEGPYRTLAQHWDGDSWTVVPTPDPDGTFSARLLSVSAISANDAWAVGDNERKHRKGGAVIIEHWDGSTWRIVRHPHIAASGLQSVSAAGPDDVWAVGYVYDGDFALQALTEHWDGQRWSVVKTAGGYGDSGFLTSVSAAASNDVWGVGQAVRKSPGPAVALIEHWDGSRWSIVKGSSRPGGSTLTSVSADSRTDAWTVGGYVKYHTGLLIEQWDGSVWTERP